MFTVRMKGTLLIPPPAFQKEVIVMHFFTMTLHNQRVKNPVKPLIKYKSGTDTLKNPHYPPSIAAIHL